MKVWLEIGNFVCSKVEIKDEDAYGGWTCSMSDLNSGEWSHILVIAVRLFINRKKNFP